MSQTMPILSSEGKRQVDRYPIYVPFQAIIGNTYSEQTRPNGLINFGIAENSLMHEEMKGYWPKHFQLEEVDFSYGDRFLGSNRLFTALSTFFNDYFHPVLPVEPEHIITGNGSTTILAELAAIICDPGQAFMVARPYYHGFDEEMTIRSGAVVVGVDVGLSAASTNALNAFEHQLNLMSSTGVKAAAVMLCNPHNPLGFNYPRETIVAYAQFCEKHNLHLVVDEVYALSQFKNDAVADKDRVPFTSILAIDVLKEAGCNPARVHALYGMSKDFGANGFRIGTFVSQHNQEIRDAFVGMGFMMKVSSVADSLWSTLLNDKEMLPYFISMNQRLLGESFARCLDFLRKHRIPYLGKPTAGMFIWINLSRLHRSTDDQGRELRTADEKDEDLCQVFLRGGLIMGLGSSYHPNQPGWFRFTFAIKQDVLDVGLHRFETMIKALDKANHEAELAKHSTSNRYMLVSGKLALHSSPARSGVRV